MRRQSAGYSDNGWISPLLVIGQSQRTLKEVEVGDPTTARDVDPLARHRRLERECLPARPAQRASLARLVGWNVSCKQPKLLGVNSEQRPACGRRGCQQF